MVTQISEEAITDATGQGWEVWFALLHDKQAQDLSHKEIVALLGENGVESGWWQQNITNEFEKSIGRRETGSTADAGFQVGVQKTVNLSLADTWKLVTSPEGMREWLGIDGPLPAEVGKSIDAPDGGRYELRSLTPEVRIRLRHHEADGDESTIQLTLTEKPTGTTIGFHHDDLPDAEARETKRGHWRNAADKILGIA
jgi:uncharacterized protein YndB with AHSA1/START domain